MLNKTFCCDFQTPCICVFQINCKKLGHQVEYEIAKLLESCPQLLRLGITLEFRDPLNRVAKQLQRNLAEANSTKRS